MSNFHSESSEIFKRAFISNYLELTGKIDAADHDTKILSEADLSAIVDLLWQSGSASDAMKGLENFLKDAGL